MKPLFADSFYSLESLRASPAPPLGHKNLRDTRTLDVVAFFSINRHGYDQVGSNHVAPRYRTE